VQPPLFRSTIIPCREIGYWGLALPLRTPRLLRPHWWGQTESQSSDNGRFDVAAGARLQSRGHCVSVIAGGRPGHRGLARRLRRR